MGDWTINSSVPPIYIYILLRGVMNILFDVHLFRQKLKTNQPCFFQTEEWCQGLRYPRQCHVTWQMTVHRRPADVRVAADQRSLSPRLIAVGYSVASRSQRLIAWSMALSALWYGWRWYLIPVLLYWAITHDPALAKQWFIFRFIALSGVICSISFTLKSYHRCCLDVNWFSVTVL